MMLSDPSIRTAATGGAGAADAGTLLIEPLAIIPRAGEIVRGQSEIDESLVTGMVVPGLKGPGDFVLAGSRNGAAALEIRDREIVAGEDGPVPLPVPRLSRHETKSLFGPFLHFWSRKLMACSVAAVLASFVWQIWQGRPVTVIGVIYLLLGLFPPGLLVVWPSQRSALQSWLQRHGLVCRDITLLSRLHSAGRFVFGRAGTLSQGQLRVVSLQPAPEVKPGDFVTLAASAHQTIEDVWGRAILAFAISRRIRLKPSEEVDIIPGAGISAKIDGQRILVGRQSWLEAQGIDVTDLASTLQEHRRLGRQVLLVASLTPVARCLGVFALADPPKAGAHDLVKTCEQSGIETLLIAGADPVATATLAGLLGVDRSIDDVQSGQFETDSTIVVGRCNDRALLAHYERSIAIGDAAVRHVPEAAFGIRREDPRHVLDFTILAQTLRRRMPLTLLVVWLTGWPVAATGIGLLNLTPQLVAFCLAIGIVMAVFLAQLLRLVGSLANDEDES